MSDDWTGGDINWNNQPDVVGNGRATFDLPASRAFAWIDIDVTPLFANGGNVSNFVVLADTSENVLIYDSKISGQSPTLTLTMAPPVVSPSEPRSVRAEVLDGQVTVDWEAPEDNPGVVTGYRVSRQVAGVRTGPHSPIPQAKTRSS